MSESDSVERKRGGGRRERREKSETRKSRK
jgi:hypothetical protein